MLGRIDISHRGNFRDHSNLAIKGPCTHGFKAPHICPAIIVTVSPLVIKLFPSIIPCFEKSGCECKTSSWVRITIITNFNRGYYRGKQYIDYDLLVQILSKPVIQRLGPKPQRPSNKFFSTFVTLPFSSRAKDNFQ